MAPGGPKMKYSPSRGGGKERVCVCAQDDMFHDTVVQ